MCTSYKVSVFISLPTQWQDKKENKVGKMRRVTEVSIQKMEKKEQKEYQKTQTSRIALKPQDWSYLL